MEPMRISVGNKWVCRNGEIVVVTNIKNGMVECLIIDNTLTDDDDEESYIVTELKDFPKLMMNQNAKRVIEQ